MNSYEPILAFWFEELTPQQHFVKDEALDQTIKTRFELDYQAAAKEETSSWRSEPEGRLAEILLLDQFSRNIYRGTPQAFSTDALALKLAKEAVCLGEDKKLPENQRAFFYMPYMHSESVEVHEEALKIFQAFGNPVSLEYEIAHKAIIDRFGRYPHRNAILNRTSTEEEKVFLKEHSGF